MKDIMSLTKSMDTVNFNGSQEINITEIIIRMKDKDMEQWNGQMEASMKGIGSKVFNMELA